ncbi:MAG: hypothetical protein ACI9U2_000536 [Bradymonadia bacterium]|jgi:hypothetical protein
MTLRRHLHAFEVELISLAQALPASASSALEGRARALLALDDARPFVVANTPLHHALNEIAILLSAADELSVVPRRRLARLWRRLARLLDVGAAVETRHRRPRPRYQVARRAPRLCAGFAKGPRG